MAKIELRLSGISPPDPDPPRTIYRDILNLPSTTYLGLTIRYFNLDDVTLYFRITGTGPGYTFGTVDLGSLGSGTSAYRNLDNFASRSKPGSGLTETVNLILRAYTDAAYTILKWTYTRTVTVIWINSADPSWTQDVLNNFDDNTVQGWAVSVEAGGQYSGWPKLLPKNDYFLSAPYSLRLESVPTYTVQEVRLRLYKSFTTPDRARVLAILDLRQAHQADVYFKYNNINRNGTVLIYIGRPYDGISSEYVPVNKWMRFVAPLPRNTTLQVRVILDYKHDIAVLRYAWLWMDDFKIISKD